MLSEGHGERDERLEGSQGEGAVGGGERVGDDVVQLDVGLYEQEQFAEDVLSVGQCVAHEEVCFTVAFGL